MARNIRRRSQGRPTICPVCGNPVRDLKTAILERESGQPAHFDCIARELAKTEHLEKDERISYLGKGTFGVISYRETGSPARHLIARRIQYEDPEMRAKWRAQGADNNQTKNEQNRRPADRMQEDGPERPDGE